MVIEKGKGYHGVVRRRDKVCMELNHVLDSDGSLGVSLYHVTLDDFKIFIICSQR